MSTAPEAATAVYSPRLWPARSDGAGNEPWSRVSSRALRQARLTAIIAGWALTVLVSSSSGPSNMSFERGEPRASSTSSNTARAAEDPW